MPLGGKLFHVQTWNNEGVERKWTDIPRRLFLTSVLNLGEWSGSRIGHFNLGKDSVTAEPVFT
jgi:hypothetical protein